jgi:hypothetical protein
MEERSLKKSIKIRRKHQKWHYTIFTECYTTSGIDLIDNSESFNFSSLSWFFLLLLNGKVKNFQAVLLKKEIK